VGRGHAVACLAHDLDVLLDPEQHREPTTEELLVVDDRDPDGLTGVHALLRYGHEAIMSCGRTQWDEKLQRRPLQVAFTSREMTP
jgi:hypothetical protein